MLNLSVVYIFTMILFCSKKVSFKKIDKEKDIKVLGQFHLHHGVCSLNIFAFSYMVGRFRKTSMDTKHRIDLKWHITATKFLFNLRIIVRQIIMIITKPPTVKRLKHYIQGMVDMDIKPGVLLVCTHMRVVNNTEYLPSSDSQREMFLTTTAETQVGNLETVNKLNYIQTGFISCYFVHEKNCTLVFKLLHIVLLINTR